jgi:hypothetical protein
VRQDRIELVAFTLILSAVSGLLVSAVSPTGFSIGKMLAIGFTCFWIGYIPGVTFNDDRCIQKLAATVGILIGIAGILLLLYSR